VFGRSFVFRSTCLNLLLPLLLEVDAATVVADDLPADVVVGVDDPVAKQRSPVLWNVTNSPFFGDVWCQPLPTLPEVLCRGWRHLGWISDEVLVEVFNRSGGFFVVGLEWLITPVLLRGFVSCDLLRVHAALRSALLQAQKSRPVYQLHRILHRFCLSLRCLFRQLHQSQGLM
jgi:hypothetical protein